jgi:hypothetical protein
LGDPPRPGYLTVSSPDLLLSVRRLGFLQHLLEVSIALVVAGSIAAAALVNAPGHAGVVGGGLLTVGLTLVRALVVAGVRQKTGANVVAFHGSGRWLVVQPLAADRALGWSIDLRNPAVPPSPLLVPGLVLAVATLVPPFARSGLAAGTPATAWVAWPTTLVVALLLLHQAATAAFAHDPAHGRFRGALPWLLLAQVAVVLLRLAKVDAGAAPWHGPHWPLPWPLLAPWLVGLWVAAAALAAARRDRLVLATLAGLMALAVVGSGGPSSQLWAAFAVVSALGSAPRQRGDGPPAARAADGEGVAA